MLDSVNYLIGNIQISQEKDKILISGIKSKLFIKELHKRYGGHAVTGLIINHTWGRLEIPIFFAYDFMEILRWMEEVPGRYFKQGAVKDVIKALERLPIFLRVSQKHPSKLRLKALERFKLTPLKNQSEFLEVYDKNTQKYNINGYILASPPGTGKTLSSLFLSEALETETTIVFSPNNALQSVWNKTLLNEFYVPPTKFVYNLDDPSQITGKERYFVFNHENLKAAKEIVFKHLKGKRVNIILDECHGFTDMKTDRVQYLIEICKFLACKDVLFMSGTPFKALGAEAIPFFWCADPYFNEKNEGRFKKVFGINGTRAIHILAARIGRTLHTVEKTDVVNNKKFNIDLKVKIPNGDQYTMSAIRKKMEVFIRERVTYYKGTEDEYVRNYLAILDVYKETIKDNKSALFIFEGYKRDALAIRKSKRLTEVKDLILRCNTYERKFIIPALPSHLKEKFRDARSVYKYVELKIQGEALGRILGKERLNCNLDIMSNLDNAKAYCEELELNGDDFSVADIFSMSEAKTIFFTDYVEVVQKAGEYFNSIGMHPLLVYADTNKDLPNIVSKIEKDPKANPLIATFKSLSTAVPLIMLDTCVMLNVPYRDYIYNQSTSRLDRLGQTKVLKFYHVYLDTGEEANISTRSKELMSWSKEMVEVLLGGSLLDDPDIVEESFIDAISGPLGKLSKEISKVFSW